MRCIALTALVAATALVGCEPGIPPEATTTPGIATSAQGIAATGSDPVIPWRNQLLKIARDAETAVNNMDSAIKNQDVAGIGAGCKQFSDSGQELRGVLPGPQPELTAAIQTAVDEVEQAASECRGWNSVGSAGRQRDDFGTHVTTAEEQIKTVTGLS
jgi:hypothetical protein